MIKSKPKTNALFSIGFFVVISFSISFYNLSSIIKGVGQWYNFVIFLILFPLAFVILIRQLIKYKVISIEKKTIKVYYPFMMRAVKSNLQGLSTWEEIKINTRNGEFRQLEMRFEQIPKISISNQENENYDKILSFLQKNVPKKKVASTP